MLLTYPGAFAGIGEFTMHKEIVEDRIAGEPIEKTKAASEAMPNDMKTPGMKNSFYDPAYTKIFDFAAEAGMVVDLHSDIYPARIKYDGSALDPNDPENPAHDGMYPDKPYTQDMIYSCKKSPNTKIIWSHTGLGRFVWPTADHLERVSAVLDACPNWSTNISWDLMQGFIINPGPKNPTFDQWVAFFNKYQDRVLWGSDTVIYKRNKIGKDGKPIIGKPMTPQEYHSDAKDMTKLWKALGPVVSKKIKIDNHVRLFDESRKNLRAWEKRHAKDDVWNLAP